MLIRAARRPLRSMPVEPLETSSDQFPWRAGEIVLGPPKREASKSPDDEARAARTRPFAAGRPSAAWGASK